ncbi:hypothetical protein JCM8097_002059 [Rhodosporidiobolus ruineniae]
MVRLAAFTVLACASAALAAPSPAPTQAPSELRVAFAKRGWLDWLTGDDDSSTTTSSVSAEDQLTSNALLGWLDILTQAGVALNTSSTCASACNTTYTVERACYFDFNNQTQAGSGDCMCNTDAQKHLNTCAQCLGGNATESASNFTTYCGSLGYTNTTSTADSGASSSFLLSGPTGIAAGLVGAGLTLLAL